MNQPSDFLFNLSSKSEKEQKKAAENMMSGMSAEQAAKVKSILSDKEKMREMLSSPQAQQLMRMLKGNGNGQHK